MTLADNSYEFICCNSVLEHDDDDRAAMGELYRIMRPGGTVMIQVPIEWNHTYNDPSIIGVGQRAIHFGQADHVRFYGRDIKSRLERTGFSVQEFTMLDVLNLGTDDYLADESKSARVYISL